MITEFFCPQCEGEFTAAQQVAAKCCCPHCGIRFGGPRIEWDGKKLVALDPIQPGEWVNVITDVRVLISPPVSEKPAG